MRMRLLEVVWCNSYKNSKHGKPERKFNEKHKHSRAHQRKLLMIIFGSPMEQNQMERFETCIESELISAVPQFFSLICQHCN